MKIYRPGDPPAPRPPRRGIPYKAIREKILSRYIDLSCGHVTTWEIVELYSGFKPEKSKFFCEICGKWVTRMKTTKKATYPQEPLF